MCRTFICGFLLTACLLTNPRLLDAQSIFGRNLIVNGDAESGPSDQNGHNPVTSFPGWTVSGAPDVVQYASGYDIGLNDVIPLAPGNNYFGGGRLQANSSLTQKIDLSSGASSIDAGNIRFVASAYLGGFQAETESAQMGVTFLDVSGQQLSSITLGPVSDLDRDDTTGLWYRRAVGPVPVGTRSAIVVLQMNWTSDNTSDGAADNLSLMLNPAPAAQALLGSNLIVNGNAETPIADPTTIQAGNTVSVPGWSAEGKFTIDSYTDPDGDLNASSPGPPDRGSFYFYGGPGNMLSGGSQDIDVSGAASLIDAGSVTYALAGWIGGYSSQDDNTVVTVHFEDWSGNALGSDTLGALLASDRNNTSELVSESKNGSVPAGTRIIHVDMTMTRTDGSDNDGMADSLSLILSSPGSGTLPTIGANGVVSLSAWGEFSSVAPGSWIEIYGTNLAPDSRGWAGSDFQGSTAPTSLDGVTVSIGGQSAFINYISPGQVDAQVPSNLGTGQQQIVLANGNVSSAPYDITVNSTEPGLLAPPSFNVGGKQYVVATIPTEATLTYVLPVGAIAGVNSRPAQPGETIVLYGVGFGSVTPDIPAGQIVGQLNQLTLPLTVSFDGTPAQTISYDGLAPNYVGLYQFNVIVPAIADDNAATLTFMLGGAAGTQTLYIAVQQ